MSTEQFDKTCCFTGHKVIESAKRAYVKEALQGEIQQAVEDGYTHFISGFDAGADLIFAAIVAELMEENPALTLEAALPYRNRTKTADKLFHRLLAGCRFVSVCSEAYSPACFMKRNREMIARSRRVIAVYDGREKGKTLFAMRCAYMHNRDLRVIRI